ncbi:MAG: hypothetical protein MPJ24_11295, partial [Pirellulaceae bacterium]|nr:hypothetical protein [Pirellulaceae bacterium]
GPNLYAYYPNVNGTDPEGKEGVSLTAVLITAGATLLSSIITSATTVAVSGPNGVDANLGSLSGKTINDIWSDMDWAHQSIRYDKRFVVNFLTGSCGNLTERNSRGKEVVWTSKKQPLCLHGSREIRPNGVEISEGKMSNDWIVNWDYSNNEITNLSIENVMTNLKYGGLASDDSIYTLATAYSLKHDYLSECGCCPAMSVVEIILVSIFYRDHSIFALKSNSATICTNGYRLRGNGSYNSIGVNDCAKIYL